MTERTSEGRASTRGVRRAVPPPVAAVIEPAADEPSGHAEPGADGRTSAVDAARSAILQRLHQATAGTSGQSMRLPTERELARELGVSRTTLRQALDTLERAGTLRRTPGRGGGTFVMRPKVERDLSEIAGVPDYLRRQGFTAGTRVLSTSTVRADDATAAALHIAPGAFVFDIVRIRLADGEPLSLEQARLPVDRFPGLLELPLGGSLYEVMRTEYRIQPARSVESIEVVLAGTDEARVLGVEPESPLLSVQRVAFDAQGVPVETSRDLFRADRTRMVVHTDEPTPHFATNRSGTHVFEVRDAAS